MKKKKNYYDMTKEELKKELDKANKKNSRMNISLYIGMVAAAISFIIIMLSMDTCNLINPSLFISRVIALCFTGGIVTTVINYIKIGSNDDKIDTIKSQIYNIITMEYEKNRYSMEKEHEKQKTNDITTNINNRIDKINLLKSYKEELNNYNIYFDSKEIKREIDGQQYVINELGGIQKVKK